MMENNLDLPKVLINSVPKSGTNLLLQIILGIPNVKRVDKSTLFHLQNGQVVTAHLAFDEKIKEDLLQNSIKQVFIYRDPRDVTVSLRHFINEKFPEHPLHKVFKNRLVTKDQQLDALICGVDLIGEEKENTWNLERYPGVCEEFKQIYLWMNEPSIYRIKYEDLTRNPEQKDKVLEGMIDFLFTDSNIEKNSLLESMKQNINPTASWTYRQGNVGNWKEEFNDEHKSNFKQVSEQLLIKTGYEKDDNW
jgi:hypothetical protein